MEVYVLCAVVAALRILPNRSQFFLYEEVSMSCGHQGWTVKRNTSSGNNLHCPRPRNNQSDCFIMDLYPSDTGVYWCESAAGGCSTAAIAIVVTDGPVILDSPVFPVTEGDPVTLRCRFNNKSRSRSRSSSNLTTDFYKDEILIRSSSTAEMKIHRVSQSDEGLYRCRTSDGAESPPSRLTVTAGPVEAPRPPPSLLPVVASGLWLMAVVLLCLWCSDKGEVQSSVVSYTCCHKGAAWRRPSSSLCSVAEYRLDRGLTSSTTLTYRPETLLLLRRQGARRQRKRKSEQ